MKPLTVEWVEKAEGDWATAQRELRARRNPNYDSACFHSQQCAEKYLKARLQEASAPFAKTHELPTLLKLLMPVEPSWNALQSDLKVLNEFAIDYRYPGNFATKAKAQDAVKRCRNVRDTVRQALGLPT